MSCFVAFHYRRYGTFFLQQNRIHNITHYKYYRALKSTSKGYCQVTILFWSTFVLFLFQLTIIFFKMRVLSTFRMHLTNKEILDKLLSYSEELKHHYNLYQLLLFHFQNKESDKFFGLIEENLKQVHPLFQTVFKTFLKDKEKIVNALQLPYSNAKLEATNNLIKLIKRNAFGFRNFNNFKKRIFIALNIKMERTTIVLSRC